MENRSEVTMMCLTEYNEAETMASLKEEAHRMGMAEGAEKADRERILDMLRRSKTPEEIADFCGYPLELVRKVEQEAKF